VYTGIHIYTEKYYVKLLEVPELDLNKQIIDEHILSVISIQKKHSLD